MSSGALPLSQLKWLSQRQSTGELICAAGPQEIHVYLQQGRVAWATSSAYPFEFARYLKEHGKIDDDTLRDVLAECRRKQLPLGETLVAWELLGWDDVRAALRHQICLVFEQLAGLIGAQTMFLERKRFTEYNHELTLELESILPEGPAGLGRARQVLEAIRGAVWVEVLDGTGLREAAPPGPRTSRIPAALIQSTLEDDAGFVAIRSARGTLLGTRVPAERGDVWCALGTDANYGIALSTLRSLGLLPAEGRDPPHAPPGTPGDEPAWTIGDLRSGSAAELRLVLDGGSKVLAAVILRQDGQPRVGIARAAVERTGCLALLARRAAIFSAPDPVRPEGIGGPDLEPLGFSSRMVVTGERDVWCFGAELLGRGETLWVLTDRAALQGIGWACLTTLVRGVALDPPRAEAAAS